MARTATKKVEDPAVKEDSPVDYENDFDDLADDILCEDPNENQDTDDKPDSKPGGFFGRHKKKEADAGDENLTVAFDFRRGPNRWPEGVEILDDSKTQALIKEAEKKASETMTKGIDGYPSGGYDPWDSIASGSYGAKENTIEESLDEAFIRDPLFNAAPPEAVFKTLADHSTALHLMPGQRLKLDIQGLTSMGANKLRKEKAKREEKRREKLQMLNSEQITLPEWEASKSPGKKDFFEDKVKDFNPMMMMAHGTGTGDDMFDWDDFDYLGQAFKTFVNVYTITMDIQVENEIPRNGLSLFQTQLVHLEENPRTGKTKVKQSDGECLVNSEGGVGVFGAFGDISKTKIVKSKWHRIVISVSAHEDSGKGNVKTWVDGIPCATIFHEDISKDGRFAVDPSSLFLFSSKNHSMMPGNILVRHIRIESEVATNDTVLMNRARDQLISMFQEEQEEQIDEQRKGLSLAALFPKPRPIWLTPALIATFGDAFIEGTLLESSSLLPWSFSVLNLALVTSIKELHHVYFAGFTSEQRAIVSDSAYVFSRSEEMMRQMMRLLKHPKESQLMSFLRKLRSSLLELDVGDSILLPALVESLEIVLIVLRSSEQRYTITVVQTDPEKGLRHHAVSATAGPPKLKYRTCLVLNDIPKKNALDNVFWMAVYNLSIHRHPNDLNKFYDVLLPFLTGKPLETSLVEAQLQEENDNVSGLSGVWASPQRSDTAYVRCLLHALKFLLMSKGLEGPLVKLVSLALRAQFARLLSNDIDYVHPAANGIRVAKMVCQQLSYATVKLSKKLGEFNCDKIMEECHSIVTDIQGKLSAFENQSIDLPEPLILGTRKLEAINYPESSPTLEEKVVVEEKQPAEEMKDLTGEKITIKIKHSLPRLGPLLVSVECDGDIGHVCKQIQSLTSVPVERQRLVHMGKVMDGSKSLKSYGIVASGKVIHLAVSQKEKVAAEEKKSVAGTVNQEYERNQIQFCDLMAWDMENSSPDPGHLLSLKKYIPVDLMQIPERVHSRQEAFEVLRQTDKLCSLIDNQNHCVKNDKFLIMNLIMHVLTRVIPMPLPREVELDATSKEISERIFRRAERKKKKRTNLYVCDDDENSDWGDVDGDSDYYSDSDCSRDRRGSDTGQKFKRAMSIDSAPTVTSLDDGDKFNKYLAAYEEMSLQELTLLLDQAQVDRDTAELKTQEMNKTNYQDDEKFTPGLGQRVRVEYLDETGVWYVGIISKVHTSHFDVVYEGDGEKESHVSRDRIRSIFAPKVVLSTEELRKNLVDPFDKIINSLRCAIDMKSNETTSENDEGEENARVEAKEESEAKPNLENGMKAEKVACGLECLWQTSEPLEYAQQLEVMVTLQRLIEHFMAAVMSPAQSRFLDAVTTIIPGCLSAVADAVMRIAAFDTPSEVCTHLKGKTKDNRQLGVPGFGIGVAMFGEQSENIEIHFPELALARTAVLDYFESPSQRRLLKIFDWETAPDVRPSVHLIKYLRNICRETGISDSPHLLLVDCDPMSSNLWKNYPEIRCFRDIVFWWKSTWNTDLTTYPNHEQFQWRDRMSAQLTWKWNNEEKLYDVQGYNGRHIRCRAFPDVDFEGNAYTNGKPPTERYPSTATPSFFVDSPEVFTEDDIIYRANLPGFENEEETLSNAVQDAPKKTQLPILGQHDSELLLSYLTVPYIRGPLVLSFFATDDRLHKLQGNKLRDILNAVLFEPGRFQSMLLDGVAPVMVPTSHKELLSTPHGNLLNELCFSPVTIIEGVLSLLQDALALDTGSVCDVEAADFNQNVVIILYIARLGARVDNYISLLLEDHIMSRARPLKPSNIEVLKQGLEQIREFTTLLFNDLFDDYLKKLDSQVQNEPSNEFLISRNAKLSCDLHAHKLLLMRNVTDLNIKTATVIVGSFMYLTTRHTWGMEDRDEGMLLVPEFEIYEVLQKQRRKLISCCSRLFQGDLDAVMQHALVTATSSGGGLGSEDDELLGDGSLNRWSRVAGVRSVGRYAVGSNRLRAAVESNSSEGLPTLRLMRENSFGRRVAEIADSEMLGVELDIQIGQMTLRHKHLSALKTHISKMPHMQDIFGSTTLQVSLLERAENRERYKLVGLHHDIEYWQKPHASCPPLTDEWDRTYDPSELFPSESWIPLVFEPVRKSFFDGPQPPSMFFMMPEAALPEDAEVAILLGQHQKLGGPWKLVYVFRRLRCVHVYECLSHGRQWFWSLHLTTDSRFCMKELQPSTADRRAAYPSWWRRGAGKPYPGNCTNCLMSHDLEKKVNEDEVGKSVVITREASHEQNMSGGQETYLPSHLLSGLIPDALLNEFRFWYDESWETELLIPVRGEEEEEAKDAEIQLSSEKRAAKMENYRSLYHHQRSFQRVTRVRGYPRDEEKDEIVIVDFKQLGSWLDVFKGTPGACGANKDHGISITGGLPGSVLRVFRLSFKEYQKRFFDKQKIQVLLDNLKILNEVDEDPFLLSKKAMKKRRAKKNVSAGESLKEEVGTLLKNLDYEMYINTSSLVGTLVAEHCETVNHIQEIDDSVLRRCGVVHLANREKILRALKSFLNQRRGGEMSNSKNDPKTSLLEQETFTGRYLVGDQVRYMVRRNEYARVVVLSCNADGTYHIKGMSGDNAGLVFSRVHERDMYHAKPKDQAQGEGVWHWEGMSESEDEDWEIEEIQSQETKKKENSSFHRFSQFFFLDTILDSTENNVDEAMDILNHISKISSGTFPNVESLVALIKIVRPEFVANASLGDVVAPSSVNFLDHPDTMVMLNLLYAPRFSRLYSISRTLTRIENLSHILAWTKLCNLDVWDQEMDKKYGKTLATQAALRGCAPIDLVELPRLKLSFTSLPDYNGNLQLYSLDHADLFVCNYRYTQANHMLRGIPHSLIVSNTQGELQVLVPVVSPVRPKVQSFAFSTEIVLDREDHTWNEAITHRYFLYPIHVSLSFLMTRGVESALYLMLLRLLHREYNEVFRLIDSVATDTRLGATSETIFKALGRANDDWHPDAHAVRLKISLVTVDSGVRMPWDLTTQCARYSVKLPHVSGSCLVSPTEEFELLQHERVIVLSTKHKLYDQKIHSIYSMTLVKNRLAALSGNSNGAVVPESAPESDSYNAITCETPSRHSSSNWPYYMDLSVFGETYSEVVAVSSEEMWNELIGTGSCEVVKRRNAFTDGQLVELSTVEAPRGGWLTVTCFHVLWKSSCAKIMSSVGEVAPSFPGVTFLSVVADNLEMSKLARNHKVNNFPTFVFMRGGVEISDSRLSSDEGIMDAMVALVRSHSLKQDELCYNAVLRMEHSLLRGDADEEVEIEEDDGIPWTWDAEQGGESLKTKNLGMDIILAPDDDNSDSITWEHRDQYSGNSEWKKFSMAQCSLLEKKYNEGILFKDGCLTLSEAEFGKMLHIWEPVVSSLNRTSYLTTGISGYIQEDGDTTYVDLRRRGRRVPVPGEPDVSAEQRIRDEKMRRQMQYQAKLKALMARERYGKDIEAIRGNVGLHKNTGIHRWTIRWHHEPSRGGADDAVGICAEAFEDFGPAPKPLIGKRQSLGLYADGTMYHGGNCVATAAHRSRALLKCYKPISEESDESEEPQKSVVEESEKSEVSKSDEECPPKESLEEEEEVEKEEVGKEEGKEEETVELGILYDANDDQLLPILKRSTGDLGPIASVLGGEIVNLWGKGSIVTCILDSDAGKLSFEVDGIPVEDAGFTDIFQKLGTSVVYPCLCIAPLGGMPEVEAPPPVHEKPKEVVEGKTQEDKKKDDTDERRTLVELFIETTKIDDLDFIKTLDDELLQQALTRAQELLTLQPESPHVGLIPELEDIQKYLSPEYLLGTKVEEEEGEEAEQEKENSASENSSNTDTDEEEEDAAVDDVEEDLTSVPMDRCVWMHQSGQHWSKYSRDLCEKLENGRRNGLKEVEIKLNNESMTVRFNKVEKGHVHDVGEQMATGTLGEKVRVRRQILSQNKTSDWECLSMQYQAHSYLHGQAALGILEKIWAAGDRMDGSISQLGFMFLYTLLQGQTTCRVLSVNMSSYGGGFNRWNYMKQFSKSDSHRFGVLLSVLYKDARLKSVPCSIINTMSRNRQMCSRLPEFKDTRKVKRGCVFNGWTDEIEPRSSIKDLFPQVIGTLQGLKRKRGIIQFPPPQPHPELPAPEKSYSTSGESAVAEGPCFTDLACSRRLLEPLSVEEMLTVANNSNFSFTSKSIKRRAPIEISDEDNFARQVEKAAGLLVVLVFTAEWCPSCQQVSPITLSLSKKLPHVQFLIIDVDDCDTVASLYSVEKLPTTKIFRNNMKDELSSVTGFDYLEFLTKFMALLRDCSTEEELADMAELEKGDVMVPLQASDVEPFTGKDQLHDLALKPLASLASKYVSSTVNTTVNETNIPFDVSKHEVASTSVAKSMQSRMKEDIKYWGKTSGEQPVLGVSCLPDELLHAACESNASDTEISKSVNSLSDLLKELRQIRSEDAAFVNDLLPFIAHISNFVKNDNSQNVLTYLLRREARQEVTIWLEYLFGVVLSTKAQNDLLQLNPHLSSADVDTLIKVVIMIMLRANRIGHANRCIGICLKLEKSLERDLLGRDIEERRRKKSAIVLSLQQASHALGEALSDGRHYMTQYGDSKFEFDPRFLIFEFMWNLMLRDKQVEIVNMFIESLKSGESKVKQMIMGAGKTTVVAPLLALMLADGDSLVLSVVPKALLEMSRKRMRETFATIVQKRIFTLQFDRSKQVSKAILRGLENAARSRGIVVATPTTIKSIFLVYIETLKKLQAPGEPDIVVEEEGATKALSLLEQSEELRKILGMFRKGAMLLDEVDLILHPLRSELNFPMGEKQALDGCDHGERWSLPMHLIDGIFFKDLGKISTFEQRGEAMDILKRLTNVVDEGYECRALQELPHITLLNLDFYRSAMVPVLAEWTFLWLQKHHLHGIDHGDTIRYLSQGVPPRSHVEAKSTGFQNSDSNQSQMAMTVGKHLKEIQKLTDEIYLKEKNSLAATEKLTEQVTELSLNIANLNKKIHVAENPRDDSLDNNVIVWYSSVFCNNKRGASTTSSSSTSSPVYQSCTKVEEFGYTIKQCDSDAEAVSRMQDLHELKQLRCVIIGGDNGTAGCEVGCELYHYNRTLCLKCWESFSSHNGHECPSGGTGSFPAGFEVPWDCNIVKLVEKLLLKGNAEMNVLTSNRVIIFGRQNNLSEEDRNKLWEQNVILVESPEDLVKAIDVVPNYEQAEMEQSLGETDVTELRLKLTELEKLRQNAIDEGEQFQRTIQDTYTEMLGGLELVMDDLCTLLTSVMNKLPADKLNNGTMLSGISAGKYLASALEWLDHGNPAEKWQGGKSVIDIRSLIMNELEDLKRQFLSVKVVCRVSSHHKKLLNLGHDWLQTFFPHILAKVNRVSFGLLNDADASRALKEDPRMPRSRLKLAVPFVGKDVPSSSSEFAHPDITLGLTILAYRYSGLRETDFNAVVDDLTSTFAREIGPAVERSSNKRYLFWVQESGGVVRGVTKEDETEDDAFDGAAEVVQLKYLQKSNKEQMDKLLELWQYEPHVIHHYLTTSVLPAHMRAQTLKISASGQAVGGDMIFGRRLGFSGTPSDLLPTELGRCDYETGDDGKMLSTMLHPEITSYESVGKNWNVQELIRRIATAEHPRCHALIDTGALITGYSNKEVAETLLGLGLDWCEGVVFLDDDDKQQVLVRATGRCVMADQCGVPLERRFAFYDQIHTTGMDIQHVVNARAVMTLGKDMVFRDYVQGAFRMRGIGKGQTVCVYIIPEVDELVRRELLAAHVPKGTYNNALVDVIAWLVINSMRAEQTQWSMLCIQNASNIFRKNALNTLLENQSCVPGLQVFLEDVSFSLVPNVPDPIPFKERLQILLDKNKDFILTEEERLISDNILVDVSRFTNSQETVSQRLESEQEREQEQEQEKEIQAKNEQETEVEKFVDREYSRSNEEPKSWPFSILSRAPSDQDEVFHPMSSFCLRHQEPIQFPNFMYFSRNYFNPSWTGLRRVKNVVMLMEWSPSQQLLRPLTAREYRELHSNKSPSSQSAFQKAYELLSARNGELFHDDIKEAVLSATDQELTFGEINDIVTEFGTGRDSLGMHDLEKLLTSGKLQQIEKGRFYVAVSLAEAETIRRIMHVRIHLPAVIDKQDTQVALRYVPISGSADKKYSRDHSLYGMLMDASHKWLSHTNAPSFQASIARNCARFLDCNMYFSDSDLNILIRALQPNSVNSREMFFTHTIGCRRRLDIQWELTPLARVFRIVNQWSVFKERAQAAFMREAIRNKRLSPWEAFNAFDSDDNGYLGAAELYGALRWLAVPNLSPSDVVDVLETADFNCDGLVDYKEYLQFLYRTEVVEEVQDADEGDNKKRPHIEPYGAEILREIIAKRNKEKLQREQDERLKRAAYTKAMDVKVFEEELRANVNRLGGPNPSVAEDSCEYLFTKNDRPLRLVATGTSKFSTILSIQLNEHERQALNKPKCPLGHRLESCWNYWDHCSKCRGRNVKYRCAESCMEYYLCHKCHKRTSESMKGSSEDINHQMTYLSCGTGSVLTLQIPAAITSDVTDCYSIMVEVRMPTLPPKGQSAALLTFVQEPVNGTKPSRVACADLYVHHDGSVGGMDEAPQYDGRLQANTFHAVHVVVKQNRMYTYVDGVPCSEFQSGVDCLQLREKINIFGVAKQSHLRGGGIKRLSVHRKALLKEEIQDHAKIVSSCSKAKLVVCRKIKGEHKAMDTLLTQLPGCDVEIVDTEVQLFALLESSKVDIVLSDLWFDEIHDADEDTLSFPGFESLNVCFEPPGLSLATKIRAVSSDISVLLGTRKPLPYDADSLPPLEVGTLIEAKFANGTAFFSGKIIRVNKNGTYKISYDDGDNESAVEREKIRLPGDETDVDKKTSFDRPNYETNLKYTQAVQGVQLFEDLEYLRVVISHIAVKAARKKQLLPI